MDVKSVFRGGRVLITFLSMILTGYKYLAICERSEGEDCPLDSKNESLRGLKNRVESLVKKIVLNQSESILNHCESILNRSSLAIP